MKNSLFTIATVVMMLSCIMAMVACSHKSKNDIVPDVSFSADVAPLLNTSCAIAGCHAGASNANGHIDFSEGAAYATIVSRGLVNTTRPAESLLYSEVATGMMPKAPYSKLPAAQISLLLNWIQQGARNN